MLAVFMLVFAVASCVKEGHVCYRFEVFNLTDAPMTVRLSSWGVYQMYINGTYNSKHRFQSEETIHANNSLIFSTEVGDEPDPFEIPASLTPAWEHIVSISCNGIDIPKAYFADRGHWDLSSVNQINGTFTIITLVITPELLEQLATQENP